jgi:hypothetical protein
MAAERRLVRIQEKGQVTLPGDVSQKAHAPPTQAFVQL